MPFCPNPDCDHRKRLGEPAEFLKGIMECSDCGSRLSETPPVFETVETPEKETGWTCPQCGLHNREDMSLCSCGHDANRPGASRLDDMPDYSRYSLAELRDVYGHIDREKYPYRFKTVVREIEKRESGASTTEEGTGWTCPRCGLTNSEDASLCSCGYDVNRPIASYSDMPYYSKSREQAGAGTPELAVEFHGSAREYFRIWIVNLCLTLLSFGIFSAWAKVRKKRYFYSHTRLDGTPFQYLGQPVPILKGRVVAAIAFLCYYVSTHFITSLLPYVLAAGMVLAPWMIIRSAAFNARYSAFRNMTFRFEGGYLDAARAVYMPGLIPALVVGTMFMWWGKPWIAATVFLAFGLSFPWWIRRFKGFIIEHTSFGGRQGIFSATGVQFLGLYVKTAGIVVASFVVMGILAASFYASAKNFTAFWLLLVPMYAGYALAYAYLQAHSGNLVWNHMQMGPVRFRSTLQGSGMAGLYFTNAVAIIASLGMLIPWAVMRTLKYRADNLRVLIAGDLMDFTGSESSAVQAAGAETMDFFDMDISL